MQTHRYARSQFFSLWPHLSHKIMASQRRFSPYQNNGGTTLGVAGKDFCVIACDTRQSVVCDLLEKYYDYSFILLNK